MGSSNSPDSYPSTINHSHSTTTGSATDSAVFVPYPGITGRAPPITTITPHILPPLNQLCNNQMNQSLASNTAYITNAIPRSNATNQFNANSHQLIASNFQNIPFPPNFAQNLFASSNNRIEHQMEAPVIAQPSSNMTACAIMDNYVSLQKNRQFNIGPKRVSNHIYPSRPILPSAHICNQRGAEKLGFFTHSAPIITDIGHCAQFTVDKKTKNGNIAIKAKTTTTNNKKKKRTKKAKAEDSIAFIRNVAWSEAHRYHQYCPFCVRDERKKAKSEFWSALPSRDSMSKLQRKEYDQQCKDLLQETENRIKANVVFKSGVEYRKHYDALHKKYGFNCIYSGCDKKSSSWYNYVAHLTQHDRENGRPFYCAYTGCNRRSSTKHNLIKHLQGVHKWKIIKKEEPKQIKQAVMTAATTTSKQQEDVKPFCNVSNIKAPFENISGVDVKASIVAQLPHYQNKSHSTTLTVSSPNYVNNNFNNANCNSSWNDIKIENDTQPMIQQQQASDGNNNDQNAQYFVKPHYQTVDRSNESQNDYKFSQQFMTAIDHFLMEQR